MARLVRYRATTESTYSTFKNVAVASSAENLSKPDRISPTDFISNEYENKISRCSSCCYKCVWCCCKSDEIESDVDIEIALEKCYQTHKVTFF